MEIERLPSRQRTTMPVSELQKLFGIKKVESYWIIHNKPIQTIQVAGKTRIVIESFEKWYANQFHYEIIGGPAPGSNWTAVSYSPRDVAFMLRISESTVYALIGKKVFKTIIVDHRTRIIKKSFENWYSKQFHYKKQSGEPPGSFWSNITWSFKEIMYLLNAPEHIIRQHLRKDFYKAAKVDRSLRVYKDSFLQWYFSQEDYLINQDRREQYGIISKA